MQEPLEIFNAQHQITASVIWLHGLGANGHDFEPVVNMLDLAHIRFVLPHAPQRPVTLNQGHVMPAWYDLYGLTADAPTDEAGLDISAAYLQSLIEKENQRGIKTSRIVVAGFSQGGAVALHFATRFSKSLAGVMALSTYLPLAEALEEKKHSENQATAWLMTHGTHDDVIVIDIAEQSQEALIAANFTVEFKRYPMAHQVCDQEIVDIKHYLLQQLPINSA